MMAPRLEACRRTLDETGSLYLHCDPAASHYLKAVLDMVMGPENLRKTRSYGSGRTPTELAALGPVHDVILFYSASSSYTWKQLHAPYSDEYIDKYFRNEDERGRYQLITCTTPELGLAPGRTTKWRGVLPPPNRHWAWTEDRMIELEAGGRLVYSANEVRTSSDTWMTATVFGCRTFGQISTHSVRTRLNVPDTRDADLLHSCAGSSRQANYSGTSLSIRSLVPVQQQWQPNSLGAAGSWQTDRYSPPH